VPIPIAALLLAHLVLYDVWFETHFFSWLISDVGLAIFITSIACLMISTIPFTTFKVVRPNKKHTFFTVLVALASLVIALIMLHSYIMRTKIDRALAESMSGFPILFFVLSLYLMMGILAYGVHLLKPNAR
jgi:phosphatidylserine synthase